MSKIYDFKKITSFLETLSDIEKQDLADELKMCALGSKKEPIELFYDVDVEDLQNYKDREENCLVAIYENRIMDELMQDPDEYDEYMETEYDEENDDLYDVIESVLRYNLNYFSPIKETEFRSFTEEINLDGQIEDFKEIYMDILKSKFEGHKSLDQILALGNIYINALYSKDEQEINNFYAEFNRF